MAVQPPLFDTEDDWRIDDRTRRIGLAGVARARAALAAAEARVAAADAARRAERNRPAA